MGVKLLPLTVAELSAHALELERDAAIRFREYADRMREIGEQKTAEIFNDLRRDQDEAVQLALLCKRRAEAFYSDVADHARDETVRTCAAEMVAGERRQVEYLEWLLNAHLREEKEALMSGTGDSPM